MKAKNNRSDEVAKGNISEGVPQKVVEKQDKMPRKKKKKHNSALAAAAMGRRAVSHVGGSAYKDTDYMNTGTNLSYRED
jgi:hypothetical protein